MWSNILLKVGIIGNGYHSKRIQKILKKKKINYFIYKPSGKSYFNEKEFELLKNNKVIFILSPNKTHFDYIRKLSKDRYIFCEKPPVNSLRELNELKKINKEKIYFNYNARFSRLSNLIKIRHKFKLGKLIYASFVIGHGLALKKEYINSWRANKRLCPKGVFEVVSIHIIDFINYHFNIKKIETPALINLSKKGNGYDTSHIKIILDNKAIVDVFSSYITPFIKKNILIFENGTIEQNEKNITINGPAINLDKKQFFIKPKLIKKFVINDENDYLNSLKDSVNYFLKIVKTNKNFKKKMTDCSLASNHLLF